MGYINHRHVIVQGWGKKFEEVHAVAKELMPEITTTICDSPSNDYHFFYIFPDGSKEGWETSNEYDEKIVQFLKYVQDKEVEVIIVKDDEYQDKPYIRTIEQEIFNYE